MNSISIVLPKGALKTNAQLRRSILTNKSICEENRSKGLRSIDKAEAIEAGRKAERAKQPIVQIMSDGSEVQVLWNDIYVIIAQGKNVSINDGKITGDRKSGEEFTFKIKTK